MSDDFGTGSGRRGSAGGRELENLRRHYREHLEALTRMKAEAPTEHLATEYQRLIGDIEASLAKLEELEVGALPPHRTGVPAFAGITKQGP